MNNIFLTDIGSIFLTAVLIGSIIIILESFQFPLLQVPELFKDDSNLTSDVPVEEVESNFSSMYVEAPLVHEDKNLPSKKVGVPAVREVKDNLPSKIPEVKGSISSKIAKVQGLHKVKGNLASKASTLATKAASKARAKLTTKPPPKKFQCSVKNVSEAPQPNNSNCQLHAKNLTIHMDSFQWLEENWFIGPYTEYLKASEHCPPLPGGGVCRYNTDDGCADGIMFYSSHSDLNFKKQHPQQIVISFRTDPLANPTGRFPPNFVEDVKVSFDRASNVPRLYVCENDRALQLYNMGQPQTPSGKKGIVGMISNCKPKWRNAYIKELMKHIPIDQVGGCYHNSKVRLDRFISKWDDVKVEFLKKSNYKYILAFENNMEPEYVTEKVFHGLLTGLVPIYYGDRSVFDYIPGNHTIIYAPDYKPKQLAEYIIQINKDDKLYAKFFEDWDLDKISGLHERYCSEHFMCKICRKVLEVKYHQEGCDSDG